MKTLYELYEGILGDIEDRLDSSDDIKGVIKEFINNLYDCSDSYTISDKPNKDGKYEVSSYGDVKIKKGLTSHNVKSLTNGLFVWSTVHGDFRISLMQKLESLDGCPKKVQGTFDVRWSNIKSLKGCPEYVGEKFMCSYCNYLETLEYAPNYVGESILIDYCRKLKSLKGLPDKINGDLYFNDCPNIKSLDGIPSTIKDNLFCKHCGEKFIKKDIKKICTVGKKINN